MEHEYYTGLSIAVMAVFAIKKLGPVIANYTDKEIEVGGIFYFSKLFIFYTKSYDIS